jgi:Tol biopolymer transport system component
MNKCGRAKSILNVIWRLFILVFLLLACQPVEGTATSVGINQTSSLSTAATFTSLPLPTLTPSFPPLTPTQAPLERLTFTVATRSGGMFHDSVIAFVSSDGTGFETPSLFEPFSDTSGISGKHLVWSPDGRYLAFDGADKMFGCGPDTGDCFYTNYGTFLADYSQGLIIEHIEDTLTNSSWSPDSQNLVLSIDEKQSSSGRDESFIGDLYILDVKSSRKTQLTHYSSSDLYPAWSPDGQWIAFIRYIPASNCGPFPRTDSFDDCDNASLYLIKPDGSDLKLLLESIHIEAPVDGRHEPYNAPSWSPDSQWLAIMVENEGEPYIINQEIALVNIETGELQHLTDNNAMDIIPTWSPDGQRLAFVSDRDGNEEIYVMNSDGTNPVNLSQDPALDYAPVWSPKGNCIAFMSNRGKLYIMNADGTNQIPINGDYLGAIGRPSWLPLFEIIP